MREEIITFPPPPPSSPIQVSIAGTSWCDGSYRIARKNHNIYVFEYVISGEGYYRLEDEMMHPAAGDVYIVPPYSDHEYGSSARNPWTKLWFNVHGELVANLLKSYRLTGIPLFKNCPVQETFEKGLACLRKHRGDPWDHLPLVMLEVIMAIHKQSQIADPTSPDGRTIRAMLEAHINKPTLSLAELSAAIKKSPAQTIRIFQRDFGVTPYHYLLQRKIETAEMLLKNTTKPIKVIAAELGFRDEYYFSNIFKQKNGSSPGHYRKS